MEWSEQKVSFYIRRLLLARMRILVRNGFYGLLLMHMDFALDTDCKTAATDGQKIYFSPDFLDRLRDMELDFVLMHEVLHAALCHVWRRGSRNPDTFNIACDIVVNSNLLLAANMNRNAITLHDYGEAMHLTPDGQEGYQYTAEQVYAMLPHASSTANACERSDSAAACDLADGEEADSAASDYVPGRAHHKRRSSPSSSSPSWDDHSYWHPQEDDSSLQDVWTKCILDACETIRQQDPTMQRGLLPQFAQRVYEAYRNPQVDWRKLLQEFIQEETVDYSFMPPDRRFDESPFFLPDYNDKDETVKDILFMIDTSGSVSDAMISVAYSEIQSAIEQWNGKLRGWLGFFEAEVIPPRPFSEIAELRRIRPNGGGGTDFHAVFAYVRRHMQDPPPVCIVLLTDGLAPFPKESLAMGIPVLWLLQNKTVTPPWGRIIRLPDATAF